MAEYMGGTCSSFPEKPLTVLSRLTGSISSQAFLEITLPVRSSVSVSSPNFRVASYSFGSSWIKGTSFVPSFITMGNTPVAKGSRVPICPAFFTRNRRFTSFTASREGIPSGLSTIRRPSISILVLSPFPMELLDHFRDVDGIFNGRIEMKGNVRCMFQPHPSSQFLSDIAPGTVQPGQRLLPFRLASRHAEIDFGQANVIGNGHPGDGNKTNSPGQSL